MSHWAEIDNANKVIRVLVGDNNDPDEGESFVNSLGGTWVKTSYNGNIRKNFAGIGYKYNVDADVFISPQPYPSWSLDNNFDWQPPTSKPSKGYWLWDEENLQWQSLEN
jgi:hypothetical protein